MEPVVLRYQSVLWRYSMIFGQSRSSSSGAAPSTPCGLFNVIHIHFCLNERCCFNVWNKWIGTFIHDDPYNIISGARMTIKVPFDLWSRLWLILANLWRSWQCFEFTIMCSVLTCGMKATKRETAGSNASESSYSSIEKGSIFWKLSWENFVTNISEVYAKHWKYLRNLLLSPSLAASFWDLSSCVFYVSFTSLEQCLLSIEAW